MSFKIGDKVFVPEFNVMGTITNYISRWNIYDCRFDNPVFDKYGSTTLGVGNRSEKEFISLDVYNSPLFKLMQESLED